LRIVLIRPVDGAKGCGYAQCCGDFNPAKPGSRAQMVMSRKILVAAALSGGMLTASLSPELLAATSTTLDMLPGDRAGDVADTLDLGSVRPIARPGREAGKPLPSGNPLWGGPALDTIGYPGTTDFLGFPAPTAARRGGAAGRSG